MNGKLKWREGAFRVEWRKGKKSSQGTVPESEIEPGLADEVKSGGGLVDVEFELPKGNPARVRKPDSAWKPAPPPPPEPARRAAPAAAALPPNTPHVTAVDVPNKSLRLSNGNTVQSGDLSIAEWKVAEGAPVGLDPGPGHFRGKWRRIDYYGGKPRCYPYNFARAPRNPAPPATKADGNDAKAQARSLRTAHPEMHLGRYRDDCHTGWIDVEACTLSPLVISHPLFASDLLGPEDCDMLNAVLQQARNGREFGPTEIDGKPNRPDHIAKQHGLTQRIRPSAQAAPGKFILPATSVKGMLRAYLEAYTHSFMPTLSEKLNGLDDEADAKIRSRTNWRCGHAGLTKEQATLYTYDFGMNVPPNGRTWRRWVRKGFTPWDKLAYLNQKAQPRHWSFACRLFGRVPLKEGKGASWAGRVRVGTFEAWDADGNPTAFAEDGYWWLRPLTRPSGAKAKCEALYLLPDGKHVAHYDDSQSEARGFKFYWPHSLGGPGQAGALPLADARDLAAAGPAAARDDQALRAGVAAMRDRVRGHRDHQASFKSWLRPVLPGARFTGRIHFQNLTAAELGALLKAIELENPPGADFATMTHTHRIGRAKPLGFGSILLRVQTCTLIDTTKAYTTLGPIHAAFKDANATTAALNDARAKFAAECQAWRSPVWDDLAALSRIPDTLTDHDYWKNWTDYQSGTATPLETAS